jgi:dihydrofolate reductase
MNLSIIAAIGQNNELGYRNGLLWHIPADLKRFKTITSGHTVIMGRRTFESIGNKPLSNRRNIILTRQKEVPGSEVMLADSVPAIIRMINPNEETFVLGGGMVYELFLPYCNKLYLTVVHQNYPADTFFPDFDKSSWEISERIDIDDDEKAKVRYSFVTYIRLSQ